MNESDNKPNLTLEPCGGKIIEQGNAFCERYRSLREVSIKRNIPRRLLILANEENPPGIKSNGQVFWELFQPWLAENYERLFEAVKDKYIATDSASLEEQKLREEVIKLRNYNKANDKSYISRKLVFGTVNNIRNKWVEVLRQKLEHELPLKCKGMEEIELKAFGRKVVDELLHQFNRPISDWKVKEEAPKEDESSAGN
jgi:hypothetical protein